MTNDSTPKQKSILFVEGNPLTVSNYQNILQGMGYNFYLSTTYEKSINLCTEKDHGNIDLVLIDLDFESGIDGIEIARKILDNRHLPIVFLTSSSDQETFKKARKITKYGYITKDSGQFALQSTIEIALELFETHKMISTSEEQFRSFVETSQKLIWKCDANGCFTYLNPAWEKTHGYKVEEMLGKNFGEFQHPEIYKRDIQEFSRHLKGGFVKDYETSHITKNGQELKLLFSAIPLFDSQGNIIGTQGTALDITERKNSEEKIQSLLNEKEIILKEVHHRIKNNMSVINSILSLQAESSKNSDVISALNNAANRIQSMMVLYDSLYQSSNYIQTPIREYLLPLIDLILKIFPEPIPLTIKKNISDFMIDGKKLSSLGIIINELLTNIMKYAFIGKKEGFIAIEAYLKSQNLDESQVVVLTIQDNGNSIPNSIDFENSPGFGLNLIGALTQQLQGTILIERNQGTKIILEFEK